MTNFDGEKLLKSYKVSGSGTGTIYTVPAGRYTKICFQEIRFPAAVGSITVGPHLIAGPNNGNVAYASPLVTYPGSANAVIPAAEFWLDQGQTIVGASLTGYDFMAFEYERRNS